MKLLFTGASGTGKTTVGRALAGYYREQQLERSQTWRKRYRSDSENPSHPQ